MLKMLSIFCALALLTSSAAFAGTTMVVLPGHEKWVSQEGGYSMAVLSGDPSKSGPYVVRLKTGANWKFPAHTHPMTENITVISGMFYVGQGTKMDMAKMKGYGPGTFLMVPANTAHFAMTKTPTVLELSGDAPLKDVMIK